MVQWLRLRATTAGGKGSIPGQGTNPGSSIHGLFQARVLEWVAIAFSEPTVYSPPLNIAHFFILLK